MKPIFPRMLLLFVLAGLLLGTLGVRADTVPRTLAEVRADLAAFDPYAPGADLVLDRLLIERALARATRTAAAG